MALYDDYLNQNNLYSRPSEMMSNVNDYLGANRASLPMNQNSLGSMMSIPDPGGGGGGGTKGGGYPGGGGGFTIGTPWFAQPGDQGPGPDIYGKGKDLLSQFVGDLGDLNENQQGLLLDFITGGGKFGDDAKGVSPEEYAQLFNVSTDYSDRFQGFPQLTDISQSISNVFNYRDEQRAFEQRAAQQAQIAQSNRTQGGLRRDLPRQRKLERKQTQDTLNQRQGAVDRAASSEYGTLLSHLKSALRSGWAATSVIHDENPDAVYGWNAGDDDGNENDSGPPPRPEKSDFDQYKNYNGRRWYWNSSKQMWEDVGPG